MTISPRFPTRRSPSCSARRRGGLPGPTAPSWIRRRSWWTPAVFGCLGRWSSRTRLGGWSSSPTAAAAAGRSSRNQFVAAALNRVGLGTLLVDLLTADEELSRAYVFNIAMLAGWLTGITRWLRGQPVAATLPFGYFGASTGAAAALWAAAASPRPPVAAVVSRGGRPDLVGRRLALVQVPTLPQPEDAGFLRYASSLRDARGVYDAASLDVSAADAWRWPWPGACRSVGTLFPATSGSTARCQPRPHPRPAGIHVASCAASPAASALPRASASPPTDLAPARLASRAAAIWGGEIEEVIDQESVLIICNLLKS